jgi:hypothetical protein
MEAFPRTWILLAIALIVLGVNLVFLRSPQLKTGVLIFLGLSMLWHAFVSFNPVLRAINMHFAYGYPLDLTHGFLAHVIAVAVFDLALAAVLGLLFFFIPADVLTTLVARFRRRA